MPKLIELVKETECSLVKCALGAVKIGFNNPLPQELPQALN